MPVAAGNAVTPELLVAPSRNPEAGIRPGERAVDVVATGSPRAVAAGARVDVLVTVEGRDRAAGTARLALEDVEVLASRAAAASSDGDGKPPRVTATLRVSVRQAVYLGAAQAFAREIRLLARAPGDHRHTGDLTVDDRL